MGGGQKIVFKSSIWNGKIRMKASRRFAPGAPESPFFERNVQSGVNETSKTGARVQGQGYREKQMADRRQPATDSKKQKADTESLL